MLFFTPEGQLISCSYDYLSEDWNSISFVLYAYIFNYCVPVGSCVFFYSQIVMAVVKHEKALKEQAKKMNVESLRQGDHVSKVYYDILFGICYNLESISTG